jgi:phosphoglycolate phosphatase
MRYDLAIFDFDGTLADSLPWFLDVFNEIADRFRFIRMERSELDTLRRYRPHKILRLLGIPLWKVPIIASYMRALMTRNIDRIALFEGVADVLRRLAGRRIALAVVSSNSRENVRRVLGPEVAALVDYYECGASLFGKKSKFKKVLARSGVAPTAAICIGDEIRDLEAARSAGIAFGAVSWGYNDVEALRAHSPTEVFTTPADLADKVG